MTCNYSPDDFIMVAKRENNNKRAFLYVNPLQGKHIPVSPSKALAVFSALSDLLLMTYPNEKLLIIGFAETATAIGNAVAYYNPNVSAFLTTTREDVQNAEYLFFSESHSHATEQRLVINRLDEYISAADRIVFAEDEVTTGNTIEKLISALKSHFPNLNLNFGIASILNSMSEEQLLHFKENNIICSYLAKIPFGYRTDEVDSYKYLPLTDSPQNSDISDVKELVFKSPWNQRIIGSIELVRNTCDSFISQFGNLLPSDNSAENVLILGTEEFMFPGLILGQALENNGFNVRFHATSRSPIEISDDADYPLHERFSLKSFYDSNRSTFIYNLKKYDCVLIVSDSSGSDESGKNSLIRALAGKGNDNIILIRWSCDAV